MIGDDTMCSINDEVMKNLLHYRKKRNMTQKELAEKLGVKHNTISSWENGTTSINVDILFKICEILKISLIDIYGRDSIVNIPENDVDKQNLQQLVDDYKSLNSEGQEYIQNIMDLVKYKYSKLQ